MALGMTFSLAEVRLALDVLARVAALGSSHHDLLNAPEYSALMRKFGELYSAAMKPPDNDNGGTK